MSDLRISGDTYCLFHLDDACLVPSMGLAAFLGCPAAETIALEKVVPADAIPLIIGAVRAIRSGRIAQRVRTDVVGKPNYELDWCFFLKGGSTRVIAHISISRRPTTDERIELTGLSEITDAIAFFDRENRLTFCNRSYHQFFDPLEAHDLRGKTFSELVLMAIDNHIFEASEAGPLCFAEQFKESFLKGGLPLGLLQRDGSYLRLLHHRMADGGCIAVHATVTDLAREKAEAISANQAKSTFLSVMSHELRTPLTSLLGMLDLLDEEPDANRRTEMLGVIRRSGETLRDLINDILDVSKIEAGKMRLERTGFHPVDIVRNVVERHREAARWKDIDLSVKLDGSYARLRRWDSLRFGQIVDNLLSNAIKFTKNGKVSVELYDFSGKPVSLCVRDTGIGMTRDQINLVRQPFVQADPSTTRIFGGSGLGLSIVSKLVDMAGGSLEIESTPGLGSAFRVILPMDEIDAGLREEEQKPLTAASLAGRSVLVADDDSIIRDVISGYLRKAGAAVTAVESGQAAVDAVMSQSFDLVLLDNAMPGMTGTQAMQVMRQRLGAHCPPMVVATASSMDHEVREFMKAGFDLHLPKPFRKEDVARLLSTLLKSG